MLRDLTLSTLVVYQRHAKRLNPFHLSCLPTSCQETSPFPLNLFEKAVNIKWQDKIPDTEVLKKAGMQSMHTVLKLHVAQLRWTGHLIRMPESDFQIKSSMENYRREIALKVAGRKLQRHSQSLSEGFRHTNWVLGTDCTGAIKVARSHQQRSSSLRRKENL